MSRERKEIKRRGNRRDEEMGRLKKGKEIDREERREDRRRGDNTL